MRGTSAPDLRAYVVWLPILPDDDAAAAARASARCAGPRVLHYWDPDRALGDALGKALAIPPRRDGPRVAWDVYLLFRPGARWGSAPAFWMQQLDGVPPTIAPRLDVATLRDRVNALLTERQP